MHCHAKAMSSNIPPRTQSTFGKSKGTAASPDLLGAYSCIELTKTIPRAQYIKITARN